MSRLRPRAPVLLVAASLVVVLAIAVSAQARDDAATAREHYKKGSRAYDLGHYLEAVHEYEAAYEAKDDPALLFDIGQAYRAYGDLDAALRAYRSFLRRSPSSPNRAEVQARVQELTAVLAHAREAPPQGTMPPASSSPSTSSPSASSPPGSSPPTAPPPPTLPPSSSPPPADEAKPACPVGQLVTADTNGHCCWPGQVWHDGFCVGAPTACPPGFTVDRAAQKCSAPACAAGLTRAQDNVHCCWPQQLWSATRQLCVGIPACPAEWEPRPEVPLGGGEWCWRKPALAADVADDDNVCRLAGTTPMACDAGEFRLREHADATMEELSAARALFRKSTMSRCRQLATVAACTVTREMGSRLLLCCPKR